MAEWGTLKRINKSHSITGQSITVTLAENLAIHNQLKKVPSRQKLLFGTAFSGPTSEPFHKMSTPERNITAVQKSLWKILLILLAYSLIPSKTVEIHLLWSKTQS